MADDWIFDVLRDLRSFALGNELPAFAAQIEKASRVAEAELAALRDAPRPGACSALSRPH